MSNVPLPEPDLFYWKPSFVKGESIQIKGYTAEAMHAHAAAVSAAKDKEIAQLRAELIKSLADNAALRAEVAGLREDAERYRWLRDKQAYIGIHPHYKDLPIEQRSGWTIRLVPDVKNSFDTAIDAARKGEA